MTFEILNEAASVVYVLAGENRYPQAEPDKVDLDIVAQGVNSEGVVSGAAVTPQGAPDTTVAVAAAVVRIAGTDVAYAGGNVNCGAAAAALPRFDLIAIDNAGVASAVNGVAAAVPVFPAVPANSVIVAAVWRAANDNTITAADIVDKRCLLLGDALGTAPTLLGIIGGIATPNRSHHTLSAQAGVADDLDGMTITNVIANGEIVIIRPDAGDTITVKHNALGGADARNILCIGNADIVLDDDHDFAICIYATAIGAGSWMVLGGGGGGVAQNVNLLDGVEHNDTLAGAAARGYVIIGNSTPKWARVAPVNHAVLASDGVDSFFDTAPELLNIADTGGGNVITTGVANPRVSIPSLALTETAIGAAGINHLDIRPTIVNPAGNIFVVFAAPDVTLDASRSIIGVAGGAIVRPNGAGVLGASLLGLQFANAIWATAANTTTAILRSLHVQNQHLAIVAANTTITESIALFVQSPSWITAGGGDIVQPVYAGAKIKGFTLSNANVVITTAYGVWIEDIIGTSPANAYLIEAGPATPHMRLEATVTWAPGINTAETALLLLAGNNDNPLTETLRRVEWMDPGAGGVNFAGGERVAILV